MGFLAQLVVAKVVRPSRTVSLEAEVAAIRWAVDQGARVINLSLGGLRDPRRPTATPTRRSRRRRSDTRTRGAVVVAAVGNADQAPTSPWPYASYPAALPHVVGVSALARDGSVPAFSNRDPIYNDIAAPGTGHRLDLSAAADQRPADVRRAGVLAVRPEEYRRAEGRRSPRRRSRPPRRSCSPRGRRSSRTRSRACSSARRWTRTHRRAVAAARCSAIRSAAGDGSTSRSRSRRSRAAHPPDRYETNDDAGSLATPLRVPRASFTATLDFWDDPTDVYKTYLRRGQRLTVTVAGPRGSGHEPRALEPGNEARGPRTSVLRQRAAQSARRGSRERIGTALPSRAGTTCRCASRRATPAPTGSRSRSAKELFGGHVAQDARGVPDDDDAAARPSSRPRPLRRTPPRRSRRPGQSTAPPRRARRGGSSARARARAASPSGP